MWVLRMPLLFNALPHWPHKIIPLSSSWMESAGAILEPLECKFFLTWFRHICHFFPLGKWFMFVLSSTSPLLTWKQNKNSYNWFKTQSKIWSHCTFFWDKVILFLKGKWQSAMLMKGAESTRDVLMRPLSKNSNRSLTLTVLQKKRFICNPIQIFIIILAM